MGIGFGGHFLTLISVFAVCLSQQFKCEWTRGVQGEGGLGTRLLGMFSRNYLASFGLNGEWEVGEMGAGSGLDC